MDSFVIKLEYGYYYFWKDKNNTWQICTEDCEGIKSGNVGEIEVLSTTDYNGKEIGLTVCGKTEVIDTRVLGSFDEYIDSHKESIARKYSKICFSPENISSDAILSRLSPLLKSNDHVRQCVVDLLQIYGEY